MRNLLEYMFVNERADDLNAGAHNDDLVELIRAIRDDYAENKTSWTGALKGQMEEMTREWIAQRFILVLTKEAAAQIADRLGVPGISVTDSKDDIIDKVADWAVR